MEDRTMQTEAITRTAPIGTLCVMAMALFLIPAASPAAQPDTTAEPSQAAPLQLEESGLERRARCESERQACVSQCAVLPQVRTCRQSCENQFQSCRRGQRRPVLE